MKLHQSVLVKETLHFLNVKNGGRYIDATYGAGGHAREILKMGGIVLGLDVNQDAVNSSDQDPNLKVIQANFSQIRDVAEREGFSQVDGVLFDFGISSDELAIVEGLSFQREEPLDMRLDQKLGVSAADLLNALPETKLAELFFEYGDEMRGKQIAGAIVRSRLTAPFKNTGQLVRVVESIKGTSRGHRVHPATQVFQALRIAVNGELDSIKDALPQAQELLKRGGRLVTISFHSGEDRLVKEFIKSSGLNTLTKKPVQPSDSEIIINPRSRSAKLRAAEKI